jgi:hypothetical protein
MENKFLEISRRKSSFPDWNNRMQEWITYIWVGERTICEVVKTIYLSKEETIRELPLFWKFKTVTYPERVDYGISVRTIWESKLRDIYPFTAEPNNDEEAFSMTLDWLDKHEFK